MPKSCSSDVDFEPPSRKRLKLVSFEPIRLPPISTFSDLDRHVLAFQNNKLAERLRSRKRLEEKLQQRIEQLENRQTKDDAVLCIINRHWNRLDEDLRILLQRFDCDESIDRLRENQLVETSSFLQLLGQIDDVDLDEGLQQRVEWSRRATAKLLQVYEHILQQYDFTSKLLQQFKEEEKKQVQDDIKVSELIAQFKINGTGINTELLHQNKSLHLSLTTLQERNYKIDMEHKETLENFNAAQVKIEELQSKLQENDYELSQAQREVDKLSHNIREINNYVQKLEGKLDSQKPFVNDMRNKREDSSCIGDSQSPKNATEISQVSRSQLEEITVELEDTRELAANRLNELQELQEDHKVSLSSIEQLRQQLIYIPSSVITSSADYVCLQSQFSVLYNESVHIRTQLEEAREQLSVAKITHLKQIEQMESEELLAQKQLRAEMIQLEEQLNQVRKEYEMLRVEFEQNLAANEQTGPLNKEMRQLLNSCKIQAQQLKTEVNRYKKKWREAVNIIARLQKEVEEERSRHDACIFIEQHVSKDTPQSPVVDDEVNKKEASKNGVKQNIDGENELECNDSDSLEIQELKKTIKNLKAELDTFKRATKDDRERMTVLTENERLRHEINVVSARDRAERKKLVTDEHQRQIKRFEDQNEQLKKDYSSCKQEEDVLLNEMEVTGQAFEDMQEQNLRLTQQLREKDDANFKLMSERIRSNQQMKLLREEKELIEEQVVAFQNQVEAQNLVVRKLEEKERLLQNSLSTSEKELNMRQQGLELHKRKALEATQNAADLKLQLEKLSAQLTDVQASAAEKTNTLQDECFKMRRLQEEISTLRKKLERAKKIEEANTADEVLLEEIRELKELLTCPSCKVNRKNAILLKCFHVFCIDCIKSRYEARQRKCPKCNQCFGANDYHRIYIS